MAACPPLTTSELPTAAWIRLRCWGDFILTDLRSGAYLKLRGRKARALLTYLAFHPGKQVGRERLMGLLWGDRGEEQARASLRQAILELKPFSNGGCSALTIERDHLTLHAGALVTEIDEMRAVVGAGDYATLVEILPDSDEQLFANLDDLDEAFDDWLAIERTRQHDALVSLIADASAAALAEGQTRCARALHARLREFDPAADSLPEVPPVAASPVASTPALRDRTAVENSGVDRSRRLRLAAVAALLVTLVTVILGTWFVSRSAAPPAPTVAVLPFTSVPGQNASFADGLSDEITAQLAHQRGLRVAGRTSAAQFRDRRVDLVDIGRKLRVRYVLEGSVRSAGERVRVNVALSKTSDGLQLWSETFDGTLDDVLAIQYRIAANVAHALNLKLGGAGAPTGSLATDGQVYSLYLTARGLIRERNPDAFNRAQEKLLRAVTLDPNFAPAWSSLAETENPGGLGPNPRVMTARAIAHANRALALAPDLAEAHGVLGMLYGFEDPLGRRHIERAVALDPNNAEFQFWLGNVYAVYADFPRMLDAYRRAYALDPLWNFAQEYAVRSAWEMGYRDGAVGYVRRVQSDGSAYQAHLIRSTLAQLQGDLSQEATELAKARDATSDPGRKASAEWGLAAVFEKLGMFDAAYEVRRRAGMKSIARPETDVYIQLRRGKLPTISELRQRNRNIRYSWQDLGYVSRAARLLTNARRAADVVSLYDGEGILNMSPHSLPAQPARIFDDGPVIAAALRAVGRNEEADKLLAHLDREIGAAIRRSGGRVPPRFLALAAQTWAMRGNRQAALTALERATANGWLYHVDTDDSSLADIGDEPAFRSLRGEVRFEAIRARINGNLARERAQTIAALRT